MFRSNKLLIFLAVVTALASLSSATDAQDRKSKKPKFDVEKFLTRLDTNKNGKVEPSEIKDDRTRGFLEKSGVDPSKPISIKSYAKQIDKKREQRKNPRSSQQSLGFAVDDEERENESGASLGFVVSDEEREPVMKARTRQFSDGAKKMLDWCMKNYDKNKDGKIDKNEIKAGRWADPPASVSDTNKDGSLSRMELLVRYQNREDSKAKRDSGRESRRSSRTRDRSSRERSKSSSRTSTTTASTKSTSENKAGNRDVRKGYESYVKGLFKSYDKNKDGFLDEKEVDGMRRKPDKKADANGDKKISKDELIDSYLEKAGQGRGKKSRSGGISKRSSGSSTSSSADGKTRSPLTGKDKNKNGQIEMAEYVSDWTVENVDEFDKIDKNKDGVITKAEWDSK